MKDFIQFNKFSKLHDNVNFVFCKTDFLYSEFENIKNINNNVVLISGNSDYPITDEHIKLLPKNVIKWYAQNALSNSDILIPLPLGLENKLPSNRSGHGIGFFDRVSKKEYLLNRNLDVKPIKFIYSNFNIQTNYEYRYPCKVISKKEKHIVWEKNRLSLEQYFDKILKYKMVFCPMGNGVDTHRVWETLYSKRIPIIIKNGDYKIYKLYEELPIILLDNLQEMSDKKVIQEKYDFIKSKNFNTEMLFMDYWINKIKQEKHLL